MAVPVTYLFAPEDSPFTKKRTFQCRDHYLLRINMSFLERDKKKEKELYKRKNEPNSSQNTKNKKLKKQKKIITMKIKRIGLV